MTGRAYLDHASTSPLRPKAAAAMRGWLEQVERGDLHGDPSRIHHEGLTARVTIEEARERVAHCFGARSREVIFTSGATESIVSATWGAARRGRRIVLSAVEHSAVREASRAVVQEPAHDLVEVPVDGTGRILFDALEACVTSDTALVHVQWGNHEVGTVQPVEQVVQFCRERNVLVHVDAAQANGHVPISFADLGADLLSVSAHKLGGPTGVGALLVRRGLRIDPLLVGGDQERARRAGLENGLGIVGFAAACEELDRDTIAAEAAASRRRTDRILTAVEAIPDVVAYGDLAHRLPHLVCLGIADIEPQAVLLGLDQAGIAAHSGSACSSEALEPSPVLEAMGVDAHRSLRLSVGWSTRDADVDLLLDALAGVISRLRALAR